MSTQEAWGKFVDEHKAGRVSTDEMMTIAAELHEMDEEDAWREELRQRRATYAIPANFRLELAYGWQHLAEKWTPQYASEVEQFLSSIKPFFVGKTLSEMDGTNPGDLCGKPIRLFDGELFFYVYPSWGDVIPVNLIIESNVDHMAE